MSEAVDVKKVIVEKLKAQGKDIAEETVAAVVEALFDAVPAVVAATPNKIDDLAVPMLAVLKPHVMALVDKIDGEDDEGR